MRIVFIFAALMLFFIVSTPVLAQGLGGVANNIEIDDSGAKPGDILSTTSDGIVRSNKAYDEKMLGIIVEFPVISVGAKGAGTAAVISSGRADVNVSASNGVIEEGDFVTTSDKTGVGIKATGQGYVLGKALAAYSDTTTDGKLPVLVDIGLFSTNANVTGVLGRLLSALAGGFSNSQNFPLVLRYVSAAVVVAATLIISGVSFVRFMRSGIEAIGRNPLAKRAITIGMILNGIVVALLSAVGFGIAAAIIAF